MRKTQPKPTRRSVSIALELYEQAIQEKPSGYNVKGWFEELIVIGLTTRPKVHPLGMLGKKRRSNA